MVKNKISAILNLTEDSTRLYPLTQNRPIAALPFAGRYRIIDFLLSDISHAGIDSVALFIGESGRSVYDHIRSGSSWHLSSLVRGGIFTFSHQDWKKSLLEGESDDSFYDNHKQFINRSQSGYVFVSGSKVIANIDIRSIHHSHVRVDRDITGVYKRAHRSEFLEEKVNLPSIYFDEENNIERMSLETVIDDSEFINVGLNMFMISSEKLLEIIERGIEDKIYLELDDLIEHYINDYTMYPYEYTGFVANVDSIEKYFKANMDMLDRAKYNSLFETSIPIMTKSKHGVPAYYAPQSHVRNSFVGTDSMMKGEVKNSLLNRRVILEDNTVVHNSILLQGSHIREGARIEYAILDKNTIVDPGVSIIGKPDDIVVIAKNSHITESITGGVV